MVFTIGFINFVYLYDCTVGFLAILYYFTLYFFKLLLFLKYILKQY